LITRVEADFWHDRECIGNAMKRREFITIMGGAAAWPLAIRAEQPSGRPLIALLSPLSAATATRNIAGFRNGLRDLGFIEGRNIFLALRFAGGMAERVPALARELVDLKPDVLIAAPESSLAAVRALTTTVPILTIWLLDPVLTGTVESIAHPGQNVTGTWIAGDDALVGKRLELLKEAVPGVVRVALFGDSTDKGVIDLATNAARALGLTLTMIQVRDAAGIEAAFATAARDGAQALFVSESPFFNTHRTEFAERAQGARLPAIYGFREFAFAGGMMSYGPSLPAVYQRFAILVDKIVLKGDKPGNLPIEVPTRFELVINLKAANAIGLDIPEAFLIRADDVIE
jgi:putative tryptophan/tyrosine transport system substrate-binding protein